MAHSYQVVCHDCKQRVDMTGYTGDAVAERAGTWARYKHLSHSIAVYPDMTGWDEDYDKEYDRIMEYKEVEK
jgi:hypothetical protein